MIAGQGGKIFEGGNFLKPIRLDDNESRFYSMVYDDKYTGNNPTIAHLQKLKPYLPPYLGVVTRSNVDEGVDSSYLMLKDVMHEYRDPGILDIKVGMPYTPANISREGAANMLGCYIHGVECSGVAFRNGFNGYKGRDACVEDFNETLHMCLDKMDAEEDLLDRIDELIHIIKDLKGFRFYSASLLFTFEQDTTSCQLEKKPELFLIDFERTTYVGKPDQDIKLNRSNMNAFSRDNPFQIEDPSNPDNHSCHHVLGSNGVSIEMDAEKPDVKVLTALFNVRSMLKNYFLARQKAKKEKGVTVYIVRHGERHDYTDFSWAPSSPHPHDAPLSVAGRRQAQDVADRLSHANPHMIVSAPMQRAILSVEPLARRLRKKICIEPGLCEFLCKISRKKVPSLFSQEVTVTPWIDPSYEPVHSEMELETWPDVYTRTRKTVMGLVERCRGKGDLVICSHRSTLQTVFSALVPDFKGDTKLEYSSIAMIQEFNGKFEMVTFNERQFLRDKIRSPASNPFRHIEGYYEDLSWDNYKSTAEMWADKETEENTNPRQHAITSPGSLVSCT